MQKKGKISNDERTAKTCEIEGQSKIEFGKSVVFVFVSK